MAQQTSSGLAVSLFRFLDHTQLDTHTTERTTQSKLSPPHWGRYLHNTQQT